MSLTSIAWADFHFGPAKIHCGAEPLVTGSATMGKSRRSAVRFGARGSFWLAERRVIVTFGLWLADEITGLRIRRLSAAAGRLLR